VSQEPLIFRRISAAMEKVRWRQGQVRAIYLDAADRKALDAAASKVHGSTVHCLGYGGLDITSHDFDGQAIRPGKRSAIYLKGSGEEIAIPKRLSKWVR
jgi:hypothetical protein